MKGEQLKILVWDWAIRVFHWLFAGSITLALGIGLLADDDGSLFPWHMLLGMCAGFLLLLRLVLLLVGSRYGRLDGLLASLRQTGPYLSKLLTGKPAAHAGHNPVAWLVYVVMFSLLAGTIWTGINMSSEWAEELHETLAYLLLATIAAHLAGLLIHALIFRENIPAAMVTGRKRGPATEAIPSARPLLGLVVLVASFAFMGQLFANYEKGAKQINLPWIGSSVFLGEQEHGNHSSNSHKKHEDHDDDHDDHDDD